jgi:hypothetical protein
MNMTRHALRRGVEMAVDAEAIRLAFNDPEMVTPAKRGCVAKVSGRISLIVDPKTDSVLTILRNEPGCWSRDDLSLSRD